MVSEQQIKEYTIRLEQARQKVEYTSKRPPSRSRDIALARQQRVLANLERRYGALVSLKGKHEAGIYGEGADPEYVRLRGAKLEAERERVGQIMIKGKMQDIPVGTPADIIAKLPDKPTKAEEQKGARQIGAAISRDRFETYDIPSGAVFHAGFFRSPTGKAKDILARSSKFIATAKQAGYIIDPHEAARVKAYGAAVTEFKQKKRETIVIKQEDGKLVYYAPLDYYKKEIEPQLKKPTISKYGMLKLGMHGKIILAAEPTIKPTGLKGLYGRLESKISAKTTKRILPPYEKMFPERETKTFWHVITKRVPKPVQKIERFTKGLYKQVYAEIRKKPVKTTVIAGIGFGTGGLGLLARGTKFAKPFRYLGASLATLYGGQLGYRAAKAVTPEEKGRVVGGGAVELAAFGIGARAYEATATLAPRIYTKVVRKPIFEYKFKKFQKSIYLKGTEYKILSSKKFKVTVERKLTTNELLDREVAEGYLKIVSYNDKIYTDAGILHGIWSPKIIQLGGKLGGRVTSSKISFYGETKPSTKTHELLHHIKGRMGEPRHSEKLIWHVTPQVKGFKEIIEYPLMRTSIKGATKFIASGQRTLFGEHVRAHKLKDLRRILDSKTLFASKYVRRGKDIIKTSAIEKGTKPYKTIFGKDDRGLSRNVILGYDKITKEPRMFRREDFRLSGKDLFVKDTKGRFVEADRFKFIKTVSAKDALLLPKRKGPYLDISIKDLSKATGLEKFGLIEVSKKPMKPFKRTEKEKIIPISKGEAKRFGKGKGLDSIRLKQPEFNIAELKQKIKKYDPFGIAEAIPQYTKTPSETLTGFKTTPKETPAIKTGERLGLIPVFEPTTTIPVFEPTTTTAPGATLRLPLDTPISTITPAFLPKTALPPLYKTPQDVAQRQLAKQIQRQEAVTIPKFDMGFRPPGEPILDITRPVEPPPTPPDTPPPTKLMLPLGFGISTKKGIAGTAPQIKFLRAQTPSIEAIVFDISAPASKYPKVISGLELRPKIK